MIQTVTGPIHLEELGQTLIHEHIICTGAEFQTAFPSWLPRETVLDIAVKKLKYISENWQVRTVVDATPLTLGRDLQLLKEASERSGVQIVASTGFYFYDSFPLLKMPPEKLAEFLVDEIRNGPIRPAMFKCAADAAGITPVVQKALQTAALVHKATGIPVYCHTCARERSGIAAQQILETSGVPPEKMIFGHVSDSNDPDYALELLKKGCYASVDRIHPHNAAFAAELIRAGYEDRIFLSHDHICCYDTVMTDPPTPQGEPHGLDVVHSKILPEMRALGIAENTIEKIIAGNIIGLYRS